MGKAITYVIEYQHLSWSKEQWSEDRRFELLSEAEDYYKHIAETQSQYNFRLQEVTTRTKTLVQTIMRPRIGKKQAA